MSLLSAIPIIGSIVDGLFGIIDKSITDKDKAAQLKHDLESALQTADLTKFQDEIKAQASIVLGEVQGESWLQRNWRPLLMLSIVTIVVHKYILYPYLSWIWSDAPVLILPPDLWDLMKIGVGGYVVGRTGEKIAETVKGSK